MLIIIVAGSDVGIRTSEMAVEYGDRKGRGTIIHVDIGPQPIARKRELKVWGFALQAEADRVAAMTNEVVDLTIELAGLLENFVCTRFELDVNSNALVKALSKRRVNSPTARTVARI
jgi:hypothetical protein